MSILKSVASARKVSVCLFANHPLMMAEIERLVSHMPGGVQFRKAAPLTAGSAVPRASVYIVDFEGNLVLTQATVAKIMAAFPDARLLLVGREFSDELAFPLLRLGVKGLVRHSHLEELERAMQAIASGGYWVPRAVLSRFVDTVLKKTPQTQRLVANVGLSRREREVMQRLLENLSNKEIASSLHISERTVKFHVSNLLQKHKVGRRADLIVLAYQESETAVRAFSVAVSKKAVPATDSRDALAMRQP